MLRDVKIWDHAGGVCKGEIRVSVVIIGADHLGNIKENLGFFGITDVLHITGRNVTEKRKIKIPPDTTLIVVFVDFVNHTTASIIKKTAKAQGIPMVFAKRSWCSLKDKLIDLGFNDLDLAGGL